MALKLFKVDKICCKESKMRWFVLCKGSAEGQEFKWYAVNSVGSLIPEVPEVCNIVNGLIDFNSSKSSIALVRSKSSYLMLFVTKLVSKTQCDFASRAIYAHLVAESESSSEDEKLQLLAADLLLDSKKINIDEFIHPSGETKESGAVVDRVKLNNELSDYWKRLLLEEVKSKIEIFKGELSEEINKIIFEAAKLGEPLRDRILFDNQLNQRLDFFCELLNPKSKYGDNRKEQFISVIDDLVNFLEIGFIVDGKKLYALTATSKMLITAVMKDRDIAKISDDTKSQLAYELRTKSLPKTVGILVVVTHNIGIDKFEKIPGDVCRVLCSGAEEGWHDFRFKQNEPTLPSSIKNEVEKNNHDKLLLRAKGAGKIALGSVIITLDGSMGGGLSIITGGATLVTGVALGADGANDLKKSFSYESTEEHPPES